MANCWWRHLFFAFPKAYAVASNAFYLAIIIFIWILIFRGISIEIRSQLVHPLWKAFWVGVFFLASLSAALVLGAFLGNLVTGVPIDKNGTCFIPLWTYFVSSPRHGVFDALTLLFSLLSVVSLSLHGVTFMILKTEGEIQNQLWSVALKLWKAETILALLSIVLLFTTRHFLIAQCGQHSVGRVFFAVAALSLLLLFFSLRKKRERLSFACSSLFLLSAIGATAVGPYHYLLISSLDRSLSLTIFNAAAQRSTLQKGLVWLGIGAILILGYTFIVYWGFRGKVRSDSEDY
ncbi:hypothetical protein A7Q10_03065 [Methylacidiphilum caldifontis]|uniref:Uncharacterized protein n=1 Tax=Methylacidiphilum caldifontis TaxID=2795386 RepID=A0A4Y8P6F1_9BACT|nr:cytochrome d ubiquinol oxidase subunit II [Methylacidiphilum caldifontis]TFE65725.1 hypothetical protein A7Q10_03065 [Methylacidiphilum caldifontis]